MGISRQEMDSFAKVFTGFAGGYGSITNGELDSKGKLQVDSRWNYGPYDAQLMRHLEGSMSIGLAPVMYDNTCVWGAIDIDDNKVDIESIVKIIYENDLPLIPCYSKSKHLHIFIFFTKPVVVKSVRALLKDYCSIFALSAKTEIFPKQEISQVATPSWINLPYQNAQNEQSFRKGIKKDMSCMSLSDFIMRVMRIQHDLKEHKEVFEAIEYSDAPPCVQKIALANNLQPGDGRNSFLYSLSVYYRMKYKDDNEHVRNLIEEYNAKSSEPISEQELRGTILKSIDVETYFYKCSDIPLNGFCNTQECKKRQFGIDSSATNRLEYGQLTQIMSDPPRYMWVVNNCVMDFVGEQALMEQNAFRCQCMRYLHRAIPRIPDDKWSAILQRAFDAVKTEAGHDSDMSVGNTFKDAVKAFIHSQPPTETKTELNLGRIYKDPETGRYWYRVDKLRSKLEAIVMLRKLGTQEWQLRLEQLGALPEVYENMSYQSIPGEQFGVKEHTSMVGIAGQSIDSVTVKEEMRKADEEKF